MQQGAARAFLIVLAFAAVTVQASAAEAIRDRMEELMFSGELSVDGVRVIGGNVLAELYADRDYEPLWPDRNRIAELNDLAALAHREGLDPADYPLDELNAVLAEPDSTSPYAAADLDILASETFLRIGYQLRFGKVNPAGLFGDWNFGRELREGADRNRTIEQIVQGGSLVEGMGSIVQRGLLYRLLVDALARYRELSASGGWPAVPEGETLRLGDVDPRVASLRRRLAAEGAELAQPADPARFDEALEAAMKEFQRRHGLDPDGIAGRMTISAMNVPVARRVDQLRASLERGRWVMDEVLATGGRYVLVNIASAQVALMDGGEPIFVTRAQVGKPYRQTPVFKGEMQYLVINPTWTVPPGILRNDVLPKLKADADAYLTEKHMDLLDRDGNKVDHNAVDWASVSSRSFPYIVRQRPGPWNSLGMIKFIFPNPHFVFLHDTPSRAYFDRAERALSSGCIRVENPFELAERIMDSPAWDQAAFQAVLDTERQRTVHLERELPVLLMYWTGMADPDGTVRFFEDIYGRDAKLLEAMASAPRIDAGG